MSPTLGSHQWDAHKSVSLWCGSAMGCWTCALGMSLLGGGIMVSLSPQPENILCVAAIGHMVKIIDFGLARRCCLPSLALPCECQDPQDLLWALALLGWHGRGAVV